jgi:NAD-dependent deacetylase
VVDSESVTRLARLIRERQPCVVLTGAGISAESGIPTFRGPGGIWSDADDSTESGIPDFRSPTGIWARYDPMEYASIEAFQRDPVKVWEIYAKRLQVLKEARPNAAHLALAALERAGYVEAVVTQNIDRLHELAGSRAVVEVHGSIRTASCLGCGTRVPLAEVARLVEAHGAPPCPGCKRILKPDVVMFGELMPEEEMERAFALARSARLLLVVGSSLEVYPVASLPEETLAAGGALAIVNKGSTPYDGRAALRIDASAAQTLAAVARELGLETGA